MQVQPIRVFCMITLLLSVFQLKGQKTMRSQMGNIIFYKVHDNKMQYLVCATCDPIIIQTNHVDINDHDPKKWNLNDYSQDR